MPGRLRKYPFQHDQVNEFGIIWMVDMERALKRMQTTRESLSFVTPRKSLTALIRLACVRVLVKS